MSPTTDWIQLELPLPFPRPYPSNWKSAIEWKLVALRETPAPEEMMLVNSAEKVLGYWKRFVATSGFFNPQCECMIALSLTPKMRVRGHYLISIGTLDSTLAHPRETFRAAIVASAHSIILAHNHPSGEPEPSESDRRITRQMKEAGTILGIPLIDHVVIGHHRFFSFREAGLL